MSSSVVVTEYPIAGSYGLDAAIVESKAVNGCGERRRFRISRRTAWRGVLEALPLFVLELSGPNSTATRGWHAELRRWDMMVIGRRGPISSLTAHDRHGKRGVSHGEIGIDEMTGKVMFGGFFGEDSRQA